MRLLALVVTLCGTAFAEPGSEQKWASMPGVSIDVPQARGVVVPVQFQPAPASSDAAFVRLLGGRFSDQVVRDWILPLRKQIHEDYYRDVDDATLARGMLAGDPKGTEQDLVIGAMKGMVASLGDRHSWVRNPRENADFQKMLAGLRFSFGLIFQVDPATKTGTVLGVFAGGPAARAGISVGDRIEAAHASGDSLTLNMLRPRTGTRFTANIVKEEITLPDVASHLFPEKGVGYVDVQHFVQGSRAAPGTASNFAFLIDSLNPRGLKGLIVDLRDNPGGDVPTCMTMASLFLPGKATILLRKVKNGSPVPWGDRSGRDGPYAHGPPLAVLVNKGSASCSEIFAAAIQDHGRGAIIGPKECTYGKGVVQTLYPPQQGVRVGLTTEEWFRKTGESIQGKGVCPDAGREVNVAEEEKDAVSSRVEAQVYGEAGYLYGDPMVDKAFAYFGVR